MSRAEHDKTYKDKHKKAKICISCWRKLSKMSEQYCEYHRVKHKEYTKKYARLHPVIIERRKKERVIKGKCYRCGKSRVGSKSIRFCKICLQKIKLYKRERYQRNKSITQWFL